LYTKGGRVESFIGFNGRNGESRLSAPASPRTKNATLYDVYVNVNLRPPDAASPRIWPIVSIRGAQL